MLTLRFYILNIFLFIIIFGYSQDDPFELEKYSFIKYTDNVFNINDSLSYNQLFNKFTDIGFKGEGKVRIVHIGDSHLQADFLSGNFRRKLQTFFVGAMGGRGFIFPYKVAQTNNPLNYKVSSVGNWTSCRNVEKDKHCKLGLSGISVSTEDNNASISIKIDDPRLEGYDFDKLMVFHDFGEKNYKPFIDDQSMIKVSEYRNLGYTLFEFDENITSVSLKLAKTDSIQNKFSLYGFSFGSNDSGIVYHTIGVNGAQYESFLRCELFVSHLKALEPDWVIVSLGTNDVYTNTFDSIGFKAKVDGLIGYIKQAAPEAAILLTTPGDHRIKKLEINTNTKIASDILKQTAKEFSLSYWDFNSIMGGEGSIDSWHYYSLAHTDYLHFSRKGYEYQGKLLFNAFLKAYDDYLEKHILLKK